MLEEYLKQFKKKRKKVLKVNLKSNKGSRLLSKFLISIIIFLICLIIINQNENNKNFFKEKIFNSTFSFTKFKNYYEKLFGDIIPTSEKEENTATVFNDKLMYKDIEKYYDGEKLIVNNNTTINSISSGIVVFIGNKDNYNNTVIIQGIDGVDIWYGNLTNVNVSLYDYVETNYLLGEANSNELYLVIKKGNEYIKYEEYKNK